MYLNLLYNGKKFLYEANNKLNIGHLKEISEKILNSDKNLMHIIYNNNKYIFPNDKTFLKDLIPKGQKRTAFSIKVDEKYMTNNEDYKNDNTLTPISNRKSFDEVIKATTNLKKNIFKNFSNMWSNQKKFIHTITYKYNEFLIEIREFNRRINEVYEELFKNYTQSNINYNNYLSESNCNDMNDKLTEISNYEYQMLKFIEKEKLYFKKLNILIKKCLLMQNNKVVVSSHNLQDLYEKMFDDNFINEDFNFNMDEVDCNFESRNKLLNNTPKNSIIENSNNLSNKKISFEESFVDKPIKINKKKVLPSLSYDNNYSKNEIIGTKDKRMMISTELGKDGIQRGKIILLNDKTKKPLLKMKDKNNKNENGMIKEENEGDWESNGGPKPNENGENNPNINTLFKNRLIFRNKKSKDYNIHFKTKEEGNNNKSLIRKLSSERQFNDKNKLNNIKIKRVQSTIEVNNNLDIINSNKNIFNKKTMKSNKNIVHYDKNNSNNINQNKNDDNKNNKNNLIINKDKDKINNNITDNNGINEKNKNKSNKSLKEVKNKSSRNLKEIKTNSNNKENIENNEDKDNNKNKKEKKNNNNINIIDNENSNSVLKSNNSDSSEIAKNKINSSRKNNVNTNPISKANLTHENKNDKGPNHNNPTNKNSSKDKNNIDNNNKSNNNDKINNNSNNNKKEDKKKKRNSKESKESENEDKKDDEENKYNLKYDKIYDISASKKDESKTKKKKRRFHSKDEDLEDSKEKEENKNEKEDENDKKIKLKKKYNKDAISEENNHSDESKKEEDKNYYNDINLLKSLLTDKNNPYNKNKYGNPYNRKTSLHKNRNETPGPNPDSDEDEQKRINLLKRKKKLITNKYDFIF